MKNRCRQQDACDTQWQDPRGSSPTRRRIPRPGPDYCAPILRLTTAGHYCPPIHGHSHYCGSLLHTLTVPVPHYCGQYCGHYCAAVLRPTTVPQYCEAVVSHSTVAR